MRRAARSVTPSSGVYAVMMRATTTSKMWISPSARCMTNAHSSGAVSADAAASSLTPSAVKSPRLPLKQMFRATNKKATSPGVVCLRTGYKAATAGSSLEADDAPSSTSFEVTDVVAFEQLIRDALLITPVAAPRSETSTETAAAPSSSTETETAATLLVNHTVRELQTLLAEAESALAKPAARKAEIDRFVYKGYLPLLKYGTFALLSLQFIVYFNWIFFVFDWNLVEPTTYFLGYTSVFFSLVYHYYRCGKDDFTWKNLFEYMAHREAEKMYAEKKVNVKAVAQLQRRVADIKAELERVTA
ncbi:Mitochondrial calcium uniporter [Lotmaria passim]